MTTFRSRRLRKIRPLSVISWCSETGTRIVSPGCFAVRRSISAFIRATLSAGPLILTVVLPLLRDGILRLTAYSCSRLRRVSPPGPMRTRCLSTGTSIISFAWLAFSPAIFSIIATSLVAIAVGAVMVTVFEAKPFLGNWTASVDRAPASLMMF